MKKTAVCLLFALIPLASALAGQISNDGLLHRHDADGDGNADWFESRVQGAASRLSAEFLGGTDSSGNTGFNFFTNTYNCDVWTPVDCIDMDEDGWADILFGSTDGRICIWFMCGTNRLSFSIVPQTYNAAVWTPISATDIDGDGHADILFKSIDGSGRLCIWFMDGTTRLSASIVSATYNPAVWIPFAAADFDGDNKSDIVFKAIDGSGRTCAWYMNGATRTRTAILSYTFNSLWTPVTAVDYNNDGHADILLRTIARDRLCTWFMNDTMRSFFTNIGWNNSNVDIW